MTPTAISQILEQVCKFVFSLFFARWFLKFSLAAAVAGAVLGILVGEVLALVYLVLSRYSLNLRKYKVEIGNRKEFFSYFFPATLGLAVSSSAHFIDSLAIVNRLVVAGIEKGKAISLFGLQSGMVGSILNFPVTISLAVSAALLPTLSYKFKENAAKKNGTARTSFSIMWFAILPMTFGLVAVSFPLYKIIYPFLSDDFLFVAIKLTALGSISSLFFALSQFFVTILQARGDFRFVLASQLAGAVVKILCTVFLCAIPSINIYGIAIGNIVLSFIVAAACLFKVRKDFAFDIDEFFIPLLSSLVMLVVASMVATIVRNVYLAVVAAIVVGAAVYLLLTIPLLLRFKSLFLGKKKKGGTNEQRGTY